MKLRLAMAAVVVAAWTAMIAPTGMACADDGVAARVVLGQSAAGGHTVSVSGLSQAQCDEFEALPPDEQKNVLRVYVDADLEDLPPLDGTLAIESGQLRFAPRYPFENGLRYRAVFDPVPIHSSGEGAKAIVEMLELDAKRLNPTTVVTQIYPSADSLPENQLKFYLHFSAPMSRGEAYRHVRLLNEDGQEVEGAFLELGEELWDADHQRFTLLFDPGRVKRGLKPREEFGPAIVAGGRYTLVVDGAWRDATRTPLNSGARKDFSVGPPDDQPVDLARWTITPPEAGGYDPLLVRFGEPLDHSLLERVVWVANAAGDRIDGTINTGDGEACWQFTPAEPWTAGSYQLVAETTLEDLAGNSIGRPFEVDEFEQVERIETKTVSLPFDVK